MLYEALVTDNSSFFSKGTIRVRIPHYYNREMMWDLTEEYPDFKDEAKDEDGNELTNDFEALVYSPYGGGRNFGVFFLPQINQKGIVMPIGNNDKKFLWMGSFFESHRNDNFEVDYVNIPSDKPENEGEKTDGVVDGEANMDGEEPYNKNFIARFKTTKTDKQDNIDWQKVSTSNIITIGDKEAKITHFKQDDGWDDTSPLEYESITLGPNKDDKEGVTINYTKDKTIQEVNLQEKKITIKIDDDGTPVNLEMDVENGIKIKTEKDVTLDIDGKLKVADASDQVVLYSELKKIIKAFENHIHQTPNGPTVGGPMDTTMAPITGKTTSPKNKMKSKKVETD